MKNLQLFAVCILLTGTVSGCLQEEVVEPTTGFEWQEKVEIPCNSDLKPGLVCKEYLSGFETPVVSLHHPQESEIWIGDLNGVISSWDGESLRIVANLSEIVSRCHLEQGLLSFVFEEDFNSTQKVLLSYVESGVCEGPNQSKLILADASVENGTINVSSVRPLREVPQPYRNHNGGHLLGIGMNQYLWGLGDGGGANSPNKTAQNLSSPLGAIHLMKYQNGQVTPVLENTNQNPYILHHGLRNPWRFDVDPSGGLWITDVGQSCFEEINYVSLNESHNLGWSMREGYHEFDPLAECGSTPLNNDSNYTDPIEVYPHEGGNCSISGGEWMDWGAEPLRDGYLYGDFCTGTIWLIQEEAGNWSSEVIAQTGTMIVGFGHSLDDDLLIFSWAGTIYVLEDV
ncbi:MAG: PQQ-dependent sugar dehydrogenase [Candidatus Poseidoniaceae archaeon]|nr:PQQ-dependent sugar dehydrogenase [Candidatus Poseidoniaceae archaeon]